MPRRALSLCAAVLAAAAGAAVVRDAPRSVVLAVHDEFSGPWQLCWGAEHWGWMVALASPGGGTKPAPCPTPAARPRRAPVKSELKVSTTTSRSVHGARRSVRAPHRLRRHAGDEAVPLDF